MIIGEQNNKGFTFVELIAAVLISVFVTASLLTLSTFVMKQNKDTKTETSLSVETTVVMNKLRTSLQSSHTLKTFKMSNATIYEIYGINYEYYIFEDTNCYYKLSSTPFDISVLTWSNDDYLGGAIKSVTFDMDNYDIKDGITYIKVNIKAELYGIDSEYSELVRLRNSK